MEDTPTAAGAEVAARAVPGAPSPGRHRRHLLHGVVRQADGVRARRRGPERTEAMKGGSEVESY
ncbi:hypothetical protein ACP70R_034881 [Stipagrostis hirtigluma subsp. patula]